MVKLYVSLIQKGYRTIEQIPATWRAEVEQILAEEEQMSKTRTDGFQPAVGAEE